MNYDGYLTKIAYYQSKGKGISVYNSSSENGADFEKQLTQNHIPYCLVSETDLYSNKAAPELDFGSIKHLVLLQNIGIDKVMETPEIVANRIVFPAFYRNIPVSMFSIVDKTEYTDIRIDSSLIHKDYSKVIALLYMEQIESLLSQVNFTFSTPTDIPLNPDNILYTPLEQAIVEIDDKIIPFQCVFEKYIELQTGKHFFNYDDMIYLSMRILLKERPMRRHYQNRFRYILVDEFQDLNELISKVNDWESFKSLDDPSLEEWRRESIRFLSQKSQTFKVR